MKIKKTKILFILPHLRAGGAERVVSSIFKNLDRTIFEPYLVVLGFENEDQYSVEGENIIYFNKKRLRSALVDIIKIIKKLKPSIVFGSIGHINVYLGFLKFFFPKIKFIAREASVYSKMKSFNKRRQLPYFVLKRLYLKLDAIVYQSGDMKNDFENTFGVLQSQGHLIHNPITLNSNKHNNTLKIIQPPFKFIIVGSLVVNKGHDRVIELFKNLKLDYVLEVVGDGPLRENLENIVLNSEMTDKVIFRGLQKDMEVIYTSADFLIQGSFVEGFPNVVLEALSFGIPCIVFEAPGGHREMIVENKNGYFIKNKEEAPEVIERALRNNWDKGNIQKDAFARFGTEKIIKQYEKMFLKIKNQ
ncbi:glycosyltransferase [Flavobacteriaceae bacterium]|nr:glycosyltransferase [Flavobacteriaceae bacterium]